VAALGRVTGYPTSIRAKLILRGDITERGIVPPEDCIFGETYNSFINELAKRKIKMREVP